MSASRRPFITIAALTGLVALAGPIPAAFAQQGQAVQPRPPSITVTKVEKRPITASIIVSGNVVAREEVMVVAEVDGLTITEVLAEEGDRVERGQVLARLNRAALDVALAQNGAQLQRVAAQIAQARAQITEAEANRTQTANAFQRAQALRGDGITSADVFDQRQAAARAAEARLIASRQALASAEADQSATEAARREIELRIARSEIKAPRAGVISRRNARVGAAAGMAGEPLFRIVADGAVELEAETPETELPRLSVGLKAVVTLPGARQPVTGEIRLISAEVDRQTRLGRVRIALPGETTRAIGSFASAVIEIERREGLTVPLSAVTTRRDVATVQLVEKDTVRVREVRIGLIGEGRAELVSGVSEGDLVVARAGTFVRDGDVISPVPVN